MPTLASLASQWNFRGLDRRKENEVQHGTSARRAKGAAIPERFFGMIHICVIEGEAIAHSWTQFRRRRSQQPALRKMACGVDPLGCDTPDACFGKADPYCAIDLETGGDRSYRIGRTPTIDNNHSPKWNHEMTALIDIETGVNSGGGSRGEKGGVVAGRGGPVFPMDFQPTANGHKLLIQIFDDDVGGEKFSDLLAQTWFPLSQAIGGGRPLRVTLSLRHPKAKQLTPTLSKVKIEFRWYPLLPNPVSISSHPRGTLEADSLAVPSVYFRRSHGNLIRLYHDAHCLPGAFEPTPCHTGLFCPHSAWDDIAAAIENAKYFVFIAGWSVNPALTLRRNHTHPHTPNVNPNTPNANPNASPGGQTITVSGQALPGRTPGGRAPDGRKPDFPSGGETVVSGSVNVRAPGTGGSPIESGAGADGGREGNQYETLGELLKRKATEGVKVCVLIWDDITSRENVIFLKDGLMATYDEYTRQYFRNTKVEVAVAKRVAADDLGQVSDILKWTSFTHHQKIVLYDTENPVHAATKTTNASGIGGSNASGVAERIVGAFIGGLDLTSGRYDTASHNLFTTLSTAHKDDFYNGCLVEATAELGPREPWHDVHGRIEGPAAWDVLQTYIERIAKQAPKLTSLTAGWLTELRDKNMIRDGKKVLINPNDPRAWDVQIFRSLDHEAALFENAKWTVRFANGNAFTDKSVQQAYCYLIDRAKSFIYIENQYFMGSAQYWLDHQDNPCHNLVPFELCKRICRAIHNGEHFTVMILIPLFPEGAPGSYTIQEILHWQFQTLRMMYLRIGAKIAEVGLSESRHPKDYLSVYFVGKREPEAPLNVGNISALSGLPQDLSSAILHKRHPIYVHSKMMIVDDEYILMGSANINDRSLAGCRDTEIAFGACQPSARCRQVDGSGRYQVPYGDIHAFRLQLWTEHLGRVHEPFLRPNDIDCIRTVNMLAEENWQAYIDDTQIRRLPNGQLCPYPLHVTPTGYVGPHHQSPNLPGFHSSVIGQKSSLLPSALTT